MGRFVIGLFARRKANAAQKEKIPLSKADKAARIRHWSSALALIVVSPIAAMPAIFLFVPVSTLIYAIFGDASGFDWGLVNIIKSWLGGTFVILLVVLDLIYRRFWIALPIIIVVGSVGATFALKTGPYWRRFRFAALVIGTLYPVAFALANTFDWFDEPFFN